MLRRPCYDKMSVGEEIGGWFGGFRTGWSWHLDLKSPVPGLSVSGLKKITYPHGDFPRIPLIPCSVLPIDGYATVDRRERRTLGSDSIGDSSEKELLKVSDSKQVPREA